MERTYDHTCEICDTMFVTRIKTKSNVCPACRRARENRAKVEAKQKKRTTRIVLKKAEPPVVPVAPPDYCEKMRLTNPGALCGNRGFCKGCRYAGAGKCADPIELVVLMG